MGGRAGGSSGPAQSRLLRGTMVQAHKGALLVGGVAALVFLCCGPAPAQVPQHIRTLLKAQKYPEAEQALRGQLQRWPDWDAGHLLLAQIYQQTGRYELAERSALSAVGRRESFDGFMLLAMAALRLGKLNDSIGWLEKAAARRPDHAEIYKILGLDYAQGGMLQESEKAFGRAVELEPGNWEFHYLQGRALDELEELQDSQNALRRAVELNPSSIRGWTALGQVGEKLKDLAAAEESYRKALELCGPQDRECAWPLLQFGFLTLRRQGAREAEPYFRQAVGARPDWAKPHFYLGKTLVSLGDLQGARAAIETAVRLEEGKSEYHYQLAQVYWRLKEAQKAQRHLARYQALADSERKKKAVPEFSQP